MTLYGAVKERAEAKGVSIAALEREAGVANGTIAGWIAGRPYAETLNRVAKALGTSVDELLNEIEER